MLSATTLIAGLVSAAVLTGAPAQAASTPVSDFSKSGTNQRNNSTADSATGAQGTAQPGDTVKWALTYQNKTGSNATVSIADPITGGQTYVANSLQTAPNFTGSVANNTVSATGPVLSTATSAQSPTFNAAAVNFNTPGGDGYSVEGFQDNIYTVFHHTVGPTVFCATLANQVCPGWPGYSTIVDPTPGTPIGAGTTGGYTTALTNGSFIANGRLYWPVSLNGPGGVNAFGFQCLDLISNMSCGYNQFGTTPVPGYSLSGDGIAASDGNYHYLDLNGFLQCVTSTATSCGAVDVSGGPIAAAGSREVGTYGRYVYMTYQTAGPIEHLTCVDTASNSLCPGFPQAVGAPGVNYDSEVMPVVSSDGTFLGACAIHNSACFDPSGAAITNPWSQTEYAFSPGISGGFGTGVLVGTRYYTGNANVVNCFDFAQPLAGGKVQPCAEFTTLPSDLSSYTVRALANLPGCMASNGDGAQIRIFNAVTGEPCASASQSVKLTPTDYYCDGGSGDVQSWGSVTLPGLNGSEYAGATLTLLGADGNALPGWTNLAFPTSGPQTIDISSLPVSGNTASLTAQVNIAAVAGTAAVNASRVTVSWQGSPAQVVCYETVMPPVSCLQSSVVSNTATAVTRASTETGVLTDGPAGNSSGPAVFTVTPSAAQCMLHLTKTGAPDPANPGTPVTYTIAVHNTGTMAYTVDTPASFTDDITDVLMDSAFDAASLTATPGTTTSYNPTSHVISWSGPLAADETATITYSVTVNIPDAGDHSMFNEVVTPSGTPSNCAANSTDPDCSALVDVPDLKVSKSADPTDGSTVVAGDVITYTLTFQNTGQGTAAVDWTDDLTKVVDDATVTSAPAASNANLNVGPVTNGTFAVTGGVPSGATYTVTYQVTVNPDGQRGDNDLVNFVVPTGTTPPTNCVAGDPMCTEHKSPEIVTAKTSTPADGSTVVSGDEITYTLSFHNIGAATGDLDYVDFLADVLDDGAITTAPAASNPDVIVGDVANDQLPITGTIPAGATYTVTYTVTVGPFSPQGNHSLLNYLQKPGTTPPPPGTCEADANCVVHPIRHLSITKTVSTTERPAPGDPVTYTVVVTNDGGVAYSAQDPATMTDDMSDVLDDATYNGDASATAGSTPSVTGTQLAWSGPLAVNDSVTITYSVTYHGTGDTIMKNNACVPKQGQDPNCDSVQTPAALITVTKSVDPADGSTVVAGQVLTYTLTFANSGQGAGDVDYTEHLDKVLDDATITDGPTASDADLTLGALTAGAFRISGIVPATTTYTVTVQVTVKPDGQRGDNQLDNFLAETGVTPDPVCADGDPLCTHNPVPEIVPSKSVDPASGSVVHTGDVLTYTVTFHNIGKATGSVDYTDDLSDVVDDATVTSAPVASSTDLTVGVVTDSGFEITGTVPVDATYTVIYQVTIKPEGERGNDLASNFLTKTGDPHGDTCQPGDPLCTSNPMPDVIDWKTVDPTSGTSLVPGQTVTYTLHYQNIGTAPGDVNRVDDVSQLVDDATVTSQPVSSDPALTATAFGADDRSAITGTLADGQTVTIAYTVKVDDPDTGDGQLANFLQDPSDPAPTSPQCVPTDAQHPDCTTNPVGVLEVTKTVDPKNFSDVHPGDVLTYTLTFRNTGVGSAAVDYTDHMAGVLDDATIAAAPKASDRALAASTISGGTFTVTGTLAGRQTVTVTYQVRVKGYDAQGDHRLVNFLAPSGPFQVEACVSTDPLCTENSVPAPSANDSGSGTALTGGDWGAELILGALLLGAGAVLMLAGRRPRRRPA